jgi:hypothetical protein
LHQFATGGVENTRPDEAGKSMANMWTREFPARKDHARNLIADVHLRRFDVALCWKVDRFGRSLKHLVNALADLDSYGVAFVSLRDNLDLSTPSGRLMFQIIGAMAEFETLADSRASPGRAAQRQAQGKDAGASIVDIGLWQDCPSSRFWGIHTRNFSANRSLGFDDP